ncbi:MAG: hypothetical protein GXP15_15675 [Gammaproteobacteria bacterium]|nr:hypothetical protein [Gammaproteobacteria bacterium]
MQCYQHHEKHAVAVCRHCGKATCPDCCNDTGAGIACSSDCARELQENHQLQQRLKQSLGVGTNPPMPASVPTYFFFGLILLTTGIYLSLTRPHIDYLTIAVSSVFFVMSGVTYKRYRDACLAC